MSRITGLTSRLRRYLAERLERLNATLADLACRLRATVADLARLNFLLAELYAEAVLAAQKKFRVQAELVGCHGQTLYHQGDAAPFLGRKIAATWQTALRIPDEWPRSGFGFRERYLHREADVAISNTIEAGMSRVA